jgi:hypothetical protein
METTAQTLTLSELPGVVTRIVNETPIIDMHTHLYSEEFGEIGLWGIDELINYHYLIAELFRYSSLSYDEFWAMDRARQADTIWRTLFIENSPVSEATRGILTALKALGLDTGRPNLNVFRDFFRRQNRRDYTDLVLKLSNVKQLVMTNDPFDPAERAVWLHEPQVDPRFKAVLRLDPLLVRWNDTVAQLASWNYSVEQGLGGRTLTAVRRFLEEWVRRMHPVYMAASLPPEFHYPDDTARSRLLAECVLPVCREYGLPFSMMIGVRKLVNPSLRLAGDSVGLADMSVVERICAEFPENRFLVSMLSRENQHGLCVAARKFRNLLPFGCWWFMNNPSIVAEITRERLELLGTSFIPQHSDARVLDQLLYKWPHSRVIIGRVLVDKYSDLARTGWALSEAAIRRDMEQLFANNFANWIKGN